MSAFVAITAGQVDHDLLARMTDAMAYCGPDAQETWVDGGAGLGLASLAVGEAGPTAPLSLDGRTWIVADARIDGRTELAPDPELILRTYGAHGDRCVEHLIGDFAFAIWDAPRRRLFCARDHFGVVPLYYARGGDDEGIAVGNVLQALLVHPEVSDDLDEHAIGDFLLFGLKRDLGATTFADIRALPPAHSLSWEEGAVGIRRYWAPPAEHTARSERARHRVARFTELFEQAVDDRLRDDRVGTHLSGGLDSTSIAVTAKRLLERRGREYDLRAYTIESTQLAAEEQEGHYARLVAAHAGIPIESLVFDEYATRPPDEEPGWMFPEPGYIPAQMVEYEVVRRVSGFARAHLAGIGGDPLLQIEPRWPRGARGWLDALSFVVRSVAVERRRPPIGARRALQGRLGRWPPAPPPLPRWIEPDFARRTALGERWQEAWAADHALPNRDRMLHPTWPAIFAASHPGAHGLTVRVLFPFFDLRLVEHVWQVPAYPWRSAKYLLREAMRGRLPEAVRTRPKTPLFDPRTTDPLMDPRHRLALRREVQDQRLQLLATPALSEFVDVEAARDLIGRPVPAPLPRPETCFNLAHWLASSRRERPRSGVPC